MYVYFYHIYDRFLSYICIAMYIWHKRYVRDIYDIKDTYTHNLGTVCDSFTHLDLN